MKDAERLARAWIQGWIDGKPDDIPLAENFTHSSPFGTVSGRQKYLDWVKPLAEKNVQELSIVKTLGDDTEAVIWFEMTGPEGPVPSVDWIHTENGEITAIHSFYDASSVK